MSLQAPLAKVLGLGSAKEGAGHWWAQRSTAIAMLPLSLWFTYSAIGLPHGDYESIAAWIAAPFNAIGLILLVIATVYHSSLGLQVVIEDYLHGGKGFVAMVVTKLTHFALGVAGVYAVVVISVGAN